MPGRLLLLLATLLLLGGRPVAAQIYKLPFADTTASNFGSSAAIDGDRALIGASGEDICGERSGTAYVYERDDVTDEWRNVAELRPSICAPGAFFGRAVALSGDRALVATSGEFNSTRMTDAAFLFERVDSSGRWVEVARFTRESDVLEGSFATSVALDGDRALVTTSGDTGHGQYGGAAYVYERDSESGTWKEAARLTGSGGTRAGIFGGSAALSGNYAAVAAPRYETGRPGSVYVFERDPESGSWKEAARLGDIDDFFISLDLDGDRLLVGESKAGRNKSGRALLFTRDVEGHWRRSATLRPETPYAYGAFGTTVSLKGDYALVAGYDEQLGLNFNVDRVVYVFRRDPYTDRWSQYRILDIGEVAFGSALDYDAGRALIGNTPEQSTGSAYVVRIP